MKQNIEHTIKISIAKCVDANGRGVLNELNIESIGKADQQPAETQGACET